MPETQDHLDKELYLASEREDLETARALLARGANPNKRGFGWYDCALQAAARRESVELVQILLDSGAAIDAFGGYHASALCGAAQYGNLEIVNLLVAAGADLDLVGTYGSALAVARQKGFGDVVQVLEAAGARELMPPRQEWREY
ncbi:ankyrin repeat-containing domain protein [Aspergillus carlsbadensis]|nr:ankyrin repeat-containing domain protein [Aspergillus carlsbadensis]